MRDEKNENAYFTNMEESDPIIEKFMSEYIEQITEKEKVPVADDLIVNFEITYADGTNKSYTCGSESCVFGNTEDSSDEKMKCGNEKGEYVPSVSLEFEEDKWDNCRDEWSEYLKGYNCCKEEKDIKEKKEKKEIMKRGGEITVYSILQGEENTTLKGVKINLYRINGLCPILVESKETDEEGKVVFGDVEDGNYRVIEFIDKKYFNKPSYIKWNEVKIDKFNRDSKIYAINTIKQGPNY